MNDTKIKTLTVTGLLGVIVAFATYGKPLADALMGFVPFLKALSSTLPFGVWSAILALLVAMGAWAYALHWLPRAKDGKEPHLAAETIALVVAIAVTVAQQWGGNSGDILLAIDMGAVAGFLAPYIGKIIVKFAKLT